MISNTTNPERRFKVEISRTLMAGALGALGKLVTRTSPVEAYRSVLIEGKENKISFRTAGNKESVTFTMDCDNAGEFSIAVNFDAFRTAVKAGKNKTVILDPDAESLLVDNTLLIAVHAEWPEIGGTADSAATAELPENFVGALATVAPIVNRSEPRRALQEVVDTHRHGFYSRFLQVLAFFSNRTGYRGGTHAEDPRGPAVFYFSPKKSSCYSGMKSISALAIQEGRCILAQGVYETLQLEG